MTSLPPSTLPRSGRNAAPARRRGSVLILVVALLVLLALVGTAYLTTTRVDRYAAVQYESAVRLDLLVEGWKNTVVSAVVDDLFDGEGNYRPANIADDPRSGISYENFDGPAVKKYSVTIGTTRVNDPFPIRHGDEWLSPRTPWLENPYQFPDSVTNTNRVLWPYIGGPLLEDRFSAPFVAAGTLSTNGILRSDPAFSSRTNVIVTSLDLLQDGQGTVSFPALRLTDAETGRFATVLAGDADGDGIADCALQRLTEINGVTYFVGYRVIDHNSALNVNTAMSHVSDFDGSGNLVTDLSVLRNAGTGYTQVSAFFPSHVGLLEVLRDYNDNAPGPTLIDQSAEFNALNNWRFGADYTGGGGAVRAVGVEGNPAATLFPVGDEAYNNYLRTDLYFNSVGEALWMQLGRRVENPGANISNVPYRAFGMTDTSALAYRGGTLVNPNASQTELEIRLPTSLVGGAGPFARVPSRAYRADGQDAWYRNNFLLDLEVPLDPTPASASASSFNQRRTIFTANNPVAKAMPRNTAGLNTDQFTLPGAIARYAGVPNPGATVVANVRFEIDRAADPNLPVQATTLNDEKKRPAPKVDINTASFGELWRGFWEVMSYPDLRINGQPRPFTGNNDGGGTPFTEFVDLDLARRGIVEGFTPYNPYLGMQFVRGGVGNDPAQSFILFQPANYWSSFVNRAAGAFAVGFHPARMFRSPLRAIPLAGVAPSSPLVANSAEYTRDSFRMAADQVVLLRSAIAAVNAEQARRRDDNLVVRTFVGYPRGGAGSPVDDTVAVNIPAKGVNGYKEPPGNGFLVSGPARANLDTGAGNQGLLNQPVTVRVFGVARQPFITEVYANTNNQTDTNVETTAGPNPRGYVAIELFNPYPFPIDIRHCRIFTIDRTSTGPYHTAPARGLVLTDESQAPSPEDQIILDPLAGTGLATPQSNMQGDPFGFTAAGAVIVPPRGWLVLENYQAGTPRGNIDANAATDRPNSTQLSGLLGNPANGAGTNASGLVPANPRANFVYVPNLDRVMNKEFVLVRSRYALYPRLVLQSGYQGPVLQYAPPPTQALPAAPVAWDVREFAPLDSFDFTGIDCPVDSTTSVPRPTTTPGVLAAIWHYNRATPDQRNQLAGQKEWRYVYPGRYDGSQAWIGSAGYPANETGLPRQQGVRRASFDPAGLPSGVGDPWDPTDTGSSTPLATASLGQEVLGLGGNASYVWFDSVAGVDKGEFTIPLHSLEAHRDPNSTDTTMDWAHWPGMNPPVVPYLSIPISNSPGQTSAPQPAFFNRYPYGGFARTLDILQVPYIGSYWVQHAFDFHDGDIATGPEVSRFAAGVNPAAGHSVLNTAQPLPWGSNITDRSQKRIIELNAVTMDSMFAEDTDTNNDPTLDYDATINQVIEPVGGRDTIHTSKEHVGRFAPLRPSAANGDRVDLPDASNYQLGTFTPRYGDYWEDVDAWRYAWAKRLPEHFTVMSPDDDGLAQTNAAAYAFNSAAPSPINGPGPRSPDSVRNRPGTSAPKYTYAKVSNGSAPGTGVLQIEVTHLPDWVRNTPTGATITFVGGPHDGQRRPVLTMTQQGGSPTQPPRWRITFQTTGAGLLDPRPWDATAPILLGDTVRFDATPEEPAGVEGLININTASARVLSTLPWFPPFPGEKVSTTRVRWDAANRVLLPGAGDNVDDNWDLAQAIVWYRDRDDGRASAGGPLVPGGPFASIFDLYRVPAFKFAQERLIDVGIPGSQADVGILQGDFTYSQLATTTPPRFPFATDGLRFDFKEQYLLLNRVSNLITTRSDVFTVYVVVQGWRDVGLPNKAPQFVAERRDAVIVDRTAVTPNDRKPREYRVATE